MSEPIVMPKLGMTMTEGTIVEWHKEVGDHIEQDEPILTISSEKLTQEVEAPIAGVLLVKNADIGDEVEVGGMLGAIGEEGEQVGNASVSIDVEEKEKESAIVFETSKEKDPNCQSDDKEGKTIKGERIFITPLARKMAKKMNFDIELIKGTGGNGRITKLDIQRVEANGFDYQPAETLEVEERTKNYVDLEAVGEGLSPMRKAIARGMRGSLAQTAQLTLHRKVNADKLIDFQKSLRKEIDKSNLDVKLSITVLIARATVLALQDYKKMNSLYYNGELKELDEVHLGIATSLEDGLVVPVVKNAHQKTIGDLARKIKEISTKARNGEASGDLLSGATFTISNMGATGIEYFTPILNSPESGILGVGALQEELALTEEGKVKQVKRIPFSLTFDHQILDGETAAQFLNLVMKYIESPYLLTL
ncbi:2-oxo acid dehydrogenase subunit E2 [Oceanobacillus caeni]|uniref:dihydrolipoamide acetyltransferase family protein n=1 Tax=Oceanobacillus TaxID=182709 RepID=UPI000621B376|nr:dihydrolipoamide acetyltransferase family protein [Oceanobacillus caeni]KKE77922.1 branched-chain alpha-keto acid dehydrogenase subunit E2 [Bacilli bacterium VT-13-104]PZD81423.1 2-oxo acid dehydrogenase subunit E2 [Bacilli bacterium]MBU8792506.1 2-oxo acid dehydrogenase subunit E2 [Oceanobacillus caeni]MCR1836258.1 2-oxo acid dehydrogenase subunit E2 [Oceanobacillus caeni]PZD83373.1 2-oxo acid dehydrogenase subunit E2 [Bacilli bacterium]